MQLLPARSTAGLGFGSAPPEYITPDAYVTRQTARGRCDWAGLPPRLGINRHYESGDRRDGQEHTAYLRGRLQEAAG